jgi:hypothetical protein
MKKHPTASPALLIAQPNIPCWTSMKPKPNTTKTEDLAKKKRRRTLFAPLRLALEKAARQ